MNTIVYCENAEAGKQDFYAISGMGKYFLFSQRYSKGVQDYFGQGAKLSKIQISRRNKRNYKIMKTMEKIYKQIRYTEVEYGILLLNKTRRRGRNATIETMVS